MRGVARSGRDLATALTCYLQGLKNANAAVFVGDRTYDEKIPSDSFDEFNREELARLLLMIHRVNRFSGEYYYDVLENGVILQILDRMIETFEDE